MKSKKNCKIYSIVFLDVLGGMKRIKKKRLSTQPAQHQNMTSKDITQCKKYEVIKKMKLFLKWQEPVSATVFKGDHLTLTHSPITVSSCKLLFCV